MDSALIHDADIVLILAASIRLAALAPITMRHAGFLPGRLNPALRLLMACAGLFAAFGRITDNTTGILRGAGGLAGIAAWQWAARRPKQGEAK